VGRHSAGSGLVTCRVSGYRKSQCSAAVKGRDQEGAAPHVEIEATSGIAAGNFRNVFYSPSPASRPMD
jgi:hypothetical protein